MSLLEWLRAVFGIWPKEQADSPPASSARATPVPTASRALPSGRASMDTADTFLPGTWVVIPPADYESHWRTLNLDSQTLSSMAPAELLQMLADLSPEVSRALWDFLRLLNPGWEVKAFRLGSEEAEDATAKKAVDAFMDTLGDLYVTPDIVFGRLFLGAYLRGAFCAEIVLDKRGRMPIDLATPDPYSVRFRKRRDPVRGEVWQPGQWQGADFVPLDIPTFRYAPVDPMPGIPYGRPLAAPALFTSLFLLSLLHDLKRVVMQQGYPRFDVSIGLEQLSAHFNETPPTDGDFGAFVADAVAQTRAAYSQLKPDDAFVHTDTITVNKPVGTVDASSLGGIDRIIINLERMITRALKSMPLLMGINDSTTETNANRQWEIFAAGVKSLQHYCETMLESLLTLGLEAQGIQARVEFRFAELRAAEMLRDAQTEQMQIANEVAKYQAGWTSQDEASETITGHKADVPEPRTMGGGADGELLEDDGDGQERNDGGGNRMSNTTGGLQERVKIIPDGANEPLLPVPDEVEISDSERERAFAVWDETMPDYAGLLDATVVNGDTEGEERHSPEGFLRAPSSPVWTWDARAHRYRSDDGRFVGQRQMTALRDTFVDARRGRAAALAGQLARGEISLQEWQTAFRREIKTVFVDQFVLAKGGRNNMTQSDYGAVGRMIRDQYAYANNFARDIAEGKLSEAQIAQRAALYIDSSTQAFERDVRPRLECRHCHSTRRTGRSNAGQIVSASG